MDNASEILSSCSIDSGILGLAILMLGGIVFLWKQNRDNRAETKEDIKNLNNGFKSDFDKFDLRLYKFEEKMEQRFEKIDQRFEKIDQRVAKVEEKITDMNQHLFLIQTMLHMKDCCALTESKQAKKAE